MEKKRVNILLIEDDFLFSSLIQKKVYSINAFLQILYSTAFLKRYLENNVLKIDLIIVDMNGTSFTGLDVDLEGIKQKIVLTSAVKFVIPEGFDFVEKSDLSDYIANFVGENE